MATKKKLLQAAAGQAGGEALNVEDVFSTYLYEGNGDGSAATNVQTINNGIDLSGEGGMVWIKGRSHTTDHIINDTVRGAGNTLQPNLTDANQTGYYDISQFNSDGFGLDAGGNVNANGYDYASWTFRKAPKFFDVQTWSGNSAARTISHNLGTTVGTILVKKTSAAADWIVYHRSTGATQYLELNNTNAAGTYDMWNDTAPTSTEFSLSGYSKVNETGHTYVAYLFAHNDGDGEFGPDGDADIIKCGSYTGNGSTTGPEIDLGFEPQWLIIKRADGTGSWRMVDSMRGIATDGDDRNLVANENLAEDDTLFQNVSPVVDLQATGFKITTTRGDWNASGSTYIYIAIRRGTKVPEDADEVFAIDGENTSEPYHTSGFTVDMGLKKRQGSTGSWLVMDRLRQGKKLASDSTSAEVDETDAMFDYMDGMYAAAAYGEDASYGWMWKRAPGYFDVLAFSGNDTNGRSLSHNLSAEPSMVWIKARNITKEWFVATDFTSSNYKQGYLHNTNALSTTSYSSGVEIASQPTNSAIVLNDLSTVNGMSLIQL